MPDAPDIVLCSQLCRHNPADPTSVYADQLWEDRVTTSNKTLSHMTAWTNFVAY